MAKVKQLITLEKYTELFEKIGSGQPMTDEEKRQFRTYERYLSILKYGKSNEEAEKEALEDNG